MTDEERQDEAQERTAALRGGGSRRAAGRGRGAGSGAEEPAAEEPQAEPSSPPSPSSPAEDPDAPGRAAEEAPGGTPAADEPKDSAKAKDVPPGAELEPITIEPQRELSAEERARLEAEAEERARAEAEATDDAGEEPAPAREAVVDLDADARIQATGKRKTSIARVVLRAGSGEFQINKRTVEDYFPRHQHQTFVRQPLLTSGYEGKVDVKVRVHGGGIAGQAGAVRHGIARALTEIDPELRGELKRRGSADARRPREGAPQGRPEESPQAPAVLEALRRPHTALPPGLTMAGA